MKIAIAATCALFALPAVAQDRPATPPTHAAQDAMNHQQMTGRPEDHGGPAGTANMQAMMTMHHQMMEARSADPAHAWALKMIEHHRGGIEMSRIVLQHSEDADIRRMAEQTIQAQERETAELQRWVQTHD